MRIFRVRTARALFGVFGENPREKRMKRSARLSLSNPDLSSPSRVPTGTPARASEADEPYQASLGSPDGGRGRANLCRSPTRLRGAGKHATALIKSSACARAHAHRWPPASVHVNPGLTPRTHSFNKVLRCQL